MYTLYSLPHNCLQSNKMYGGKLYYIMVCNEMKDKKYYTVGTVLKSNRKTKFTTLSEQF